MQCERRLPVVVPIRSSIQETLSVPRKINGECKQPLHVYETFTTPFDRFIVRSGKMSRLLLKLLVSISLL
jgi:hypothetical protein